MDMKLSILIASIPSREDKLKSLLKILTPQTYYLEPGEKDEEGWQTHFFIRKCELILDNSVEYNIGTKRNKLLERATGDYVVYIDDDDKVSDKYVELILEACETGTDCIGINGIITTNGHDKRKWFISKEYGHWHTGADGTYYRTPNHISPVKRELALQAGFPEISFGEDAEYSRRLLPLLKTETIISHPIYHYDYLTKK